MTTTFDGKAFQAELQRLDGLLREAERSTDPAARAHARALVQAVLALHGAALERLVELLEEAGDAGRTILGACGEDEVVSGLLLLHGLHPQDVDARLQQALDRVRPVLRSQGGEVELLEFGDGVVRVRLHAGGRGSSAAMRRAVEDAVAGLVPEATAVEIEGVGQDVEDGRVPLPML